VRVESDLKEWHRTEHLYQVNERSARWLHRWLAGGQRCAAVLGHASPLLSIIRTALYLPHYAWWRPGTRGAANNGQHVPGRQPPAAAPASGTRGAEPSGPAVRLRRPHFVLDTCDRFEFAMGSVFELLFTPDRVTARCLLEPQPRVVHAERGSRPVACFPRPGGVGRNREMQRPWFGRLIEGPPGADGTPRACASGGATRTDPPRRTTPAWRARASGPPGRGPCPFGCRPTPRSCPR